MSTAIVHTDGGARPTNPGFAGIGVVVHFPDRGKTEHLSRYLGNRRTNNEAEYIALIVGAKYAFFLGARMVDIKCDSKLIVNQVNREWIPKDFRMRSLCHQAIDILDGTYGEDNWSVEHIRRESNSEADALCTDAIYYGMNLNPFTPASVKRSRPEGRVVDPFRFEKVTEVVVAALASI